MTDPNLEELLYQALRPMPCLCRRAHYNGPVVDKCRRCVAVDAYELKQARRAIVQTTLVSEVALRRKFSPRLWSRAESDAWHRNIPNIDAAFEALLAAPGCEPPTSHNQESVP
jgi:hypothetical protein